MGVSSVLVDNCVTIQALKEGLINYAKKLKILLQISPDLKTLNCSFDEWTFMNNLICCINWFCCILIDMPIGEKFISYMCIMQFIIVMSKCSGSQVQICRCPLTRDVIREHVTWACSMICMFLCAFNWLQNIQYIDTPIGDKIYFIDACIMLIM